MPSILIGLAIGAICVAILVRGIHNRRKGRGGCSCGSSCGSCACSGLCHRTNPAPESGHVPRR